MSKDVALTNVITTKVSIEFRVGDTVICPIVLLNQLDSWVKTKRCKKSGRRSNNSTPSIFDGSGVECLRVMGVQISLDAKKGFSVDVSSTKYTCRTMNGEDITIPESYLASIVYFNNLIGNVEKGHLNSVESAVEVMRSYKLLNKDIFNFKVPSSFKFNHYIDTLRGQHFSVDDEITVTSLDCYFNDDSMKVHKVKYNFIKRVKRGFTMCEENGEFVIAIS